jgi:antitoxin Phd
METAMWSLQDAKAQFSHLVDSALHGQAQHVTRHGKPAVVVLAEAEAEADYIALQRNAAAQAPGFVAHLLSMPKPSRPAAKAKSKAATQPARTQLVLRDIDFS